MVSNATKTGYYLVLLVMSLTVMGYTAERCVILDDDLPELECSKRAHAVLAMGTISAAFCLVLIALFYAGMHKILKGELAVATALVGLWAATASLVSSPRSSVVKDAPPGTTTFEGSAAFYTSWIGLVFALLLAYWAAADLGLKPPLPADAPPKRRRRNRARGGVRQCPSMRAEGASGRGGTVRGAPPSQRAGGGSGSGRALFFFERGPTAVAGRCHVGGTPPRVSLSGTASPPAARGRCRRQQCRPQRGGAHAILSPAGGGPP